MRAMDALLSYPGNRVFVLPIVTKSVKQHITKVTIKSNQGCTDFPVPWSAQGTIRRKDSRSGPRELSFMEL
jgi:hypothetical protein